MPASCDKSGIDSGSAAPEEMLSGVETEGELRTYLAQLERAHDQSSMGRDYSADRWFVNAAIYAPALSEGYIASISRFEKELADAAKAQAVGKTYSGPTEYAAISQLGLHPDDLKFIAPKSTLCFHPWVLFSAGQGAKTASKAIKNNWFTKTPRDPRVVVIGDSGGFQVQQQTIAYDPVETPKRMLTWLERVADQSMVLDFPTGGIATGATSPHVDRLFSEQNDVYDKAKKAGFSSGFIACLVRTKQNNDFFAAHRKLGATKLLNVIQGRNDAESAYWYEQVKHYDFDGWAFAGKHSTILSMTLRRLVQMDQDGLLRPGMWIHFLGISTLSAGAALTYLQRALRLYTPAKDIQLTFDSKSPVDGIAFGYQAVCGFDFAPNKWTFRTQKTNLPEHIGSETLLSDLARDWSCDGNDRVLAKTTLGEMINLGQLVGPFDPTKDRHTPRNWQQTLLIHHNTQAYIEGFRQAYRRLDDKAVLQRVHTIRHLREVFEVIFTDADPDARINECASFLDAMSFEGKFGS